MGRVVDHVNTWSSALRLLRRQGWQLWLVGELDAEGDYQMDAERWIARRDGRELEAANPVALLGLAALAEAADPEDDRPYWWSVDGEDIWDELRDRAYWSSKPLERGLEAQRLGNLEEARAQLAEAQRLDPDNPQCAYLLTRVRQDLGEFDA